MLPLNADSFVLGLEAYLTGPPKAPQPPLSFGQDASYINVLTDGQDAPASASDGGGCDFF
jgi:hypothetical protein